MFHNNWDLNPRTRHVRVGLYLFYSTWDIWAIWENWVQILQIMSRNTWKVIQNLEALLDWQSHLSIEFDLLFSIVSIMTLWEKLGPKTSDLWLGNTKSNSKCSVPYFTSNETILKCPDHLRVELISVWAERVLVLVITYLRGWFGINYPNAFLKILKLSK